MITTSTQRFKNLTLALLLSLVGYVASATTYTAILNGNWSSSATWGGAAPGSSISGADIIIIPVGITVNLDNSIAISNSLASLSVTGTLSSSSSNITLNSGTISGNGNISVPNVTVGAVGFVSFTGTINANSFTSSQTSLALAANLNISNTLTVNNGLLQLDNGSSVSLGNNGTINVNNSLINLNGGAFNFSGLYNVTYTGSSSLFSGSLISGNLNDLTISLNNSSDQLTLGGNLTVQGGLYLSTGILNLNGNNLDINGGFINTTGGSISSTTASNISITSSNDPGELFFTPGFAEVGNFNVSLTGSNSLDLNSNLLVDGQLTLSNGGAINLQNHTLTLNSSIVSTGGSINTGSSSNIILNGTGNIGSLTLMGGNIGNLTINIASNGSVGLINDLTVYGTLTTNNGSLILNGYDLTIEGGLTGTAMGYIYSDSSSNITINGTGSSSINFPPSQNNVNDLNINIGGNGSLTLNNDVVVNGALSLQNGSLNLNGHNLTLNGTVNTSGGGGIYSNSMSNIYLLGGGDMGNLSFYGGFNQVNDLVVDINGVNGSINFNTDIIVNGTLQLTNGVIRTGSNNLTLATSAVVQGGSSSSFVISDGAGHLMMSLNTATASTFHVGTTASYAPVVVTNNSNTTGYFGVNASSTVFANGTTGSNLATSNSVVNTSWDVMSDISTNLNATLEFYWQTGMEVNAFNNSMATVAHYYNNTWNLGSYGAATAQGNGAYSMSTNVTSLSTFAVFDENTLTSIHNVAAKPTFDVYPNPTTEAINITLGDPAKYKRVRMFDIIGNEMVSIPVTNTVTTIDMSTLPAGVYFVSIDNLYTRRIIKK